MPLALILSSHVATSRVGGFVQALALAQGGIDPVLVPTVLFGRHPGWGPPGGAAVTLETFEGMLGGIEANGLFTTIDLVITGYFADAGQVRAAARAIDAMRARRAKNPATGRLRVIVDPIMGDADRGLYVAAEVAEALVSELVPRADLISPNAWELERMSGRAVRDADEAREAALRLGKPALVSSTPHGDQTAPEIGVVYADKKEAWLAVHARAPAAPKGAGDLLAALFAVALTEAHPASYALARAVSGVVETIAAATKSGAAELPIAGMGRALFETSSRVRIERLG